MAVKIRLKKMGAKHQPFYRLVAADSRYQRDGRFIEIIGHYDPMTDPATIRIDDDAAFRWLDNGAICTETARSLLKRSGTLQRWKQRKVTAPQPAASETETQAA